MNFSSILAGTEVYVRVSRSELWMVPKILYSHESHYNTHSRPLSKLLIYYYRVLQVTCRGENDKSTRPRPLIQNHRKLAKRNACYQPCSIVYAAFAE